MKQRILRALYLKYQTYFHSFLVEEFLYEVPKDVREPAMTFLSQGKERLEKWALFQAHVLQTRLITDPEKIREYTGMILMLKMLLIHTVAPERKNQPVETVETKKDYAGDVKYATEGLKKMLSPVSRLLKKE